MNPLTNLLDGSTPLADTQAKIELRQSTVRNFMIADADARCDAAAAVFFASPTSDNFALWRTAEIDREADRRMAATMTREFASIRKEEIAAAIPLMDQALSDLIDAARRRRAAIAPQDARPGLLGELDRQIERLQTTRSELNSNPSRAFDTIVQLTSAQ